MRRRTIRLALAGLAAVAVAVPARAADVDDLAPSPPSAALRDGQPTLPPPPPSAAPLAARDLVTLASRETTLSAQVATARAAVRWRLRALRGLAAEATTLDGATRARALDVSARALGREVAEARSLAAERDRARSEGRALATAARAADDIGAPPTLVLPAQGPVVARFGVTPDRATGLLLPRAGVRLAAAPGAPVRAPLAGVVALVAREPEGAAVAIEDGRGWTVIVSGLAEPSVAEGQRIAAGERLGAPSGAAVGFEVWRGRRPADPMLFAPKLAAAPTLP